MAGDPALESFLGRWLMARMQDKAVAKPASDLYQAIPTLLRGEVAATFQSRLFARIAGLKALVERIDREDRPAPPNSIRGHWLRDARRLAARWDPTRWTVAALELTGEKNPLVLAAVSLSLEEAIGQGPAVRQAVEQARSLRAPVERELGSIPLPPASQAPWDPSEYLFPAIGCEVVEKADRGVIHATQSEPPGSLALERAKALSEMFRQIEAGWPVRRARLEGALRQLADVTPEGSDLAAALREALTRTNPEDPSAALASAAPDSGEPAPDPGRRDAVRRLDDLARELLSESASEAKAFGDRLRGLDALPGAATAEGLHQELIGCLAFLDAADGPVTSSRWRQTVLERLAGIAEGLGGGEVLGERLLGQPLGRWTEFVTVVDYDDQAPPGEPRRITRVDRVGYLLVFSDGARKALVRARVRIAL